MFPAAAGTSARRQEPGDGTHQDQPVSPRWPVPGPPVRPAGARAEVAEYRHGYRAGMDQREQSGGKIAAREEEPVSAMFWTLGFPASQIAVMTAMTVSICKPERLRYSELPVWLWASLGGREARARLHQPGSPRRTARVRPDGDHQSGDRGAPPDTGRAVRMVRRVRPGRGAVHPPGQARTGQRRPGSHLVRGLA